MHIAKIFLTAGSRIIGFKVFVFFSPFLFFIGGFCRGVRMPSFKISRYSSVSTLFVQYISDYLMCCSRGIFDIFRIHVVYTRAFTIPQFLGCHTDLFFCEKLFHAPRRIFFDGTLIILLKNLSKEINDFIGLLLFCVDHVAISIVNNQSIFCFLFL